MYTARAVGTVFSLIKSSCSSFLLVPGPSGVLSTTDRQSVTNKLEKLISMIKFSVFAHKYSRAYIDTLDNLEQASKEEVAQVEKNLQLINMNDKCLRTGNVMESQPYTLYEKMIEFVPLLPEDVLI